MAAISKRRRGVFIARARCCLRWRRCVLFPAAPQALAELEDVALGVPEVAPVTLGVLSAVDLRYGFDAARDQGVTSGVDVVGREPDLVARSVVLRLVAALQQLEDVREAHVEVHPPLTGAELAEPDCVAVEAPLRLQVLDDDTDPVRPPELRTRHLGSFLIRHLTVASLYPRIRVKVNFMSSPRLAGRAPNAADLLPIGEVAGRSGLAPSALRFYESIGLIRSERSGGGQRLYRRHVLRRVAVIRVAQRMGLTLNEIGETLSHLPGDRAPTRAEWERLSRVWREELSERIATLERLRDDLTGLEAAPRRRGRGCGATAGAGARATVRRGRRALS